MGTSSLSLSKSNETEQTESGDMLDSTTLMSDVEKNMQTDINEKDSSTETSTQKSYRAGKSLKDSSEFIAKSEAFETTEEPIARKYSSTASIYADTPTIKIRILPQDDDDDDERDENGRSLYRNRGFNRTRSRLRVSTRTSTESLNAAETSTQPTKFENDIKNYENQETTTKRSYSALSRTRTRTTTSKSTDLDEVEENPTLETSTRRGLNRFATRTTAATTENPLEKGENSTRPALNALNRLRNRGRTTTTTTTTTITEDVDGTDNEENKSSSSTEASKRRTYSGINRLNLRTTTVSPNEDDNEIKKLSTKQNINRFIRLRNRTQTTELTSSKTNKDVTTEVIDENTTTQRTYGSINRSRNRTSTEVLTDSKEKQSESSTRAYVNLNRQRTTTAIKISEKVDGENEDVEDTTTPFIDTTDAEPKFEINQSTETPDDELSAEIEDDIKETTVEETSEENFTEGLTADISDTTEADEIETSTIADQNESTHRAVLIRKRLRITTPVSANENESTTESAITSKPSRRIIIRKRLNSTATDSARDTFKSTTARNIVTLDRQRYKAALGTTEIGIDAEEEITSNPIQHVVGQTNRHRALAIETSDNLVEKSNETNLTQSQTINLPDIDDDTESSIEASTRLTIARGNRVRSTTAKPIDDEVNSSTTATSHTTSTRRTFLRRNRIQTSSQSVVSEETSLKNSSESSTRSSIVRPNPFRTTTVSTEDNIESTESTPTEKRRTFSRINRFQSTTNIPEDESTKEDPITRRSFSRPDRLRTTNTPSQAIEENSTPKFLSRNRIESFGQRSRPTIATRTTTSTRRNLPAINRALYNRADDEDDEDQDENYDEEEYEYDSEPAEPSRKPPSFSRAQQFSSVSQRSRTVPTRKTFGANRANDVVHNEQYEDDNDDDDEYDDETDGTKFEHTNPSTTERSNLLQNLRNRVRLSQTRVVGEDKGTVNSRLKDLLANKPTTTLKPIKTTSEPDSSQNDSSSEEINDEIKATNKQKSTSPNKPITSLLANRSNTNRSSTVANYRSRIKTNLNVKSNQTQSTIRNDNEKQNVADDEKDYIEDLDSHISSKVKGSDINNISVDDKHNVDEDFDSNVSSKVKGNEVNSKRRFQKFQYNRTRTTTTSTTDNKQTDIADQVNQLVDNEDNDEKSNTGGNDDDDDEDDDDENENDDNSSPATKPIRISVLRNRRPLIVNNVNSTSILNQTTLVDNNVSSNATTFISATNETNTAKITSKLNTLNIEKNINETNETQNDTEIETETETETETTTLSSDTTPTKRYRKIIRKLIRPISTTPESNTVDDEVTTIIPEITSSTVQTPNLRRRNGTRFGLNRSISTNRTQAQSVIDEESEKINRKEASATIRGKSRFSLNNIKSDTENATTKATRFNSTSRTRFGSRNKSSTESTIDDTEIEEDDSAEDEDEREEEEEVKTTLTSSTPSLNRLIPIRRPFQPVRSSSTTANPESNDDDDLVAELDEEDENKTTTKNDLDLQKLRDKVKVEQAKGNRDNGVVNTRLRKILVVRKNGTIASKTEIPAGELSEQEEDALQKIRNKVKQEQAKGENDLGVVNSKLKKLLEEKSKTTNSTTSYIIAKEEEEKVSNVENNDDLDIQKIRDKVKLQQARGDQDRGVISTRLKAVLAERTAATAEGVNGTVVSNESNNNNNNTDVETDKEAAVQPRPFAPRRPFSPNARTKTSTEASSISSDSKAENVSSSTTKAPLVRPGFRKKLVARRPYSAQRPNISTTVAPARPQRKFSRPTSGPGRFAPLNATNRNNSNRFKTEGQTQNENNDEDDDYESEEDETESDNDKASTPITLVVTPRPAIARPSGFFNRSQTSILKKPLEKKQGEDDEEDENDDEDEDDDEEEIDEESSSEENVDENKSKSNAPSTYRPKDFRVPPGARPGLPPTALGNVPFNSRNRPKLNQSNRITPGSNSNNRYAPSFGRSTTVRPRIVNRPSGVAAPGLTIRPIAVDFERTTPAIPTKPAPFISTNTRSYERKYLGPSTETPETNVDNSLFEDLNIEALNARNKKIFDINSKKHTTLKPKISTPLGKSPTDQQADSQDTRQNTESENDDEYTKQNPVGEEPGYVTITPRTHTDNTDNLNNNDNVLSSQDHVGYGSSTSQPPTTTLLHVFTLTEDEHTSTSPPTGTVRLVPRIIAERVRPKHKVVEVNRIVEINSKEDKLRRKSKANQEFLKHIGTSTLKVESLPHIEQLGEISVVKYVHLVDGSDISIDGHSTVADYTPTEATVARNSVPVRNSLPDASLREYAQLNEGPRYVHIDTERSGKALIPEVIREAVETSTISLEGLFDNARQAKELNTIDGNNFYAYGYNFATTTSTTNSKESPATSQVDTTTTITSQVKPETKSKYEGSTIVEADGFTVTPVVMKSNHAIPTIVEADGFTVSPAQLKHEKPETTLPTTNVIPKGEIATTIATTENPFKATTVATALFPTYVRPIVPLLRPESNESSPLVISIANLDKVILSKVEKAQKALQNNNNNNNNNNENTEATTEATEVADSNAEFSSRYASVVKAPKNLIVDLDSKQSIQNKNEGITKLVTVSSVGDAVSSTNSVANNVNNNLGTDTNTSSNNNLNSINNSSKSISKIVSYRTESHVVRKKKSRSRKSKSRKLKNSNRTSVPKRPATEIDTTSATATTEKPLPITTTLSDGEGYETTTAKTLQ